MMPFVIPLFLLILGFFLVIKGANFLVDGASSLAKKFAISEIVIGLTVVAFGTSAPELIVNIFSSIQHKSDIVLGNIIGSNIFNILLILGIAGVIYPLTVHNNTVWKEIPYSFFAVLLLAVLVSDSILFQSDRSILSFSDGIILLLCFVLFIIYTFIISKTNPSDGHDIVVHTALKTTGLIIAGFSALFLGGKLVVDNAVEIAQMLNISEKLIAVTIVSGGTSLPELATSAVAAMKKKSDIAIGNVVGSNIFNIFLILGVSALISPVTFQSSFYLELFVLIGATSFLFIAMFTGKKHQLDKVEAMFLLGSYALFMILIFWRM